MRSHATAILFLLLGLLALSACGDDSGSSTPKPIEQPDAGEDATEDTSGDADPDVPDAPDVRQLVTYNPFGTAGETNMVYVPDFDMSVFTQKWLNVTPAIDALGPNMVKEQRFGTPSGRTEILKVPGLDGGPQCSFVFGASAVPDGPAEASIWIGRTADAGGDALGGVKVQFVGVTKADGQVLVDLEEDTSTTQTIGDIVWSRHHGGLPPILAVGSFAITNTSSQSIRLNAPWVGHGSSTMRFGVTRPMPREIKQRLRRLPTLMKRGQHAQDQRRP